MKNTIRILSVLLFIISLGMMVLYGASGHIIKITGTENLIDQFFFAVNVFSAIILMIYSFKKGRLLKKVTILVLLLTLVSLIYIFYEILKVKMSDLSGLIPILILLIALLLDIKVLKFLLSKSIS
ncbi:hypothetical protein [uncultured Psychroserpens sp.]|uniref:hypothetical protein n=1 Tax=uncultured Psychroserpens sp. TaxID=255436 RepID=UPI00263272AF|nr:hypothetical protein [uncultured Psychroserpens sp.]